MAAHGEVLHGARGLSRLKAAIKRRLPTEKASRSVELLADWPLLCGTQGKVAVILGGDPREEAAQKIQQAFGFAEVSWADGSDRSFQRVGQRVASGTVDLVILTRYTKHKRVAMVLDHVRSDLKRWVRLESGYGVAELQRALDAHWKNEVF